MTRDFLIRLGVHTLLLLTWVFGPMQPNADGAELVRVDLTGEYSAIVTVSNPDGSPAVGKKYRLTYVTPSEREVVFNKGTDLESKFQFEPVRLIATIAAGEVPFDGKIRLNNLAGEPRRFQMSLGEYGYRPGDVPEGFLHFSFSDPHKKTNEYAVQLAKVVALGERAPEFLARNVFTDAVVTRSNFTGKLLVLKFWATGCGPCQPEMESINQILIRRNKDWKDRVAFVAVSLDEDLKKLREHIRRRGWMEFQHVMPDQRKGGIESPIAKSYGIISIPQCYVIHPSGVVVWRGQFDEVEELTDHLLEKVRNNGDVETWINELRDAKR